MRAGVNEFMQTYKQSHRRSLVKKHRRRSLAAGLWSQHGRRCQVWHLLLVHLCSHQLTLLYSTLSFLFNIWVCRSEPPSFTCSGDSPMHAGRAGGGCRVMEKGFIICWPSSQQGLSSPPVWTLEVSSKQETTWRLADGVFLHCLWS